MKRHLFGTLFCAMSWFALQPATSWADGGTVRLSRDAGRYRLTVFTDPTPLRAGPVDVSVVVQDRQTAELITTAKINVRASQVEQPNGVVITQVAQSGSAANKLLQAAQFELPDSGVWRFDVDVVGESESTRGSFEVEVLGPKPRWVELSVWIGLPFLLIGVFAAHETLVFRERHRRSDKRSQAARV